MASGRIKIGYPDPGTFALAAAQGSYALTGQASTLTKGSSGGGKMSLPLIYSDGWESFSNAQTIGGTNMSWSNNNPNTIKASTTAARSGTKSVFFPFKANANGGQTLELDFDFSAFGTDYHEVEFEYYLLIPSGYTHPNSPSSDNNKFFRIWGNKTGNRDTDYNTITKLGCSTELGTGGTSYSDMASEWTTVADDATTGFTARGAGAANFISPSDVGTWVKINWYVKAATSLGGAGRAYLKMWKNDTLVIDERPDNYDATDPGTYHFGYLFGARNTDDDATEPDCNIYLDDLSVFAQ